MTEKNEQALSNFVSTSPWEDDPVLTEAGRKAVALMSSSHQISQEANEHAVILDESGIPKQGSASVGVARQYCGALGKVESCQVGVFLAYSVPGEATLIDRRLYLPEAWVDDPQRCDAAGIPQQAQVFRTKAQLGLEMILQAKARGLPFEFAGMDAHYGKKPWLLTCLDHEDITYMADIPCDTRVYLEYPQIGIPPRGRRGRPPTKPKVLKGKPVEVRELVPSLPWQILKVRDTQRGELWIRFAALRVWRIEDGLPYLWPEWLLIRQELDGSETKFSFSNASPDTPLTTLACRQSRRYWVERTLQDAKGLAGLDEYQVRGWRGWHHHMTMVILAMLFLLQLKHELRTKAPMLTLQDTVQILETVMPRKQLTPQQALQIIQDKHLNRSRSRNSYLRKQRTWLKATGFLI